MEHDLERTQTESKTQALDPTNLKGELLRILSLGDIYLGQSPLTLEHQWVFFKGDTPMGVILICFIEKACLIIKYWSQMSLNGITESMNLF